MSATSNRRMKGPSSDLPRALTPRQLQDTMNYDGHPGKMLWSARSQGPSPTCPITIITKSLGWLATRRPRRSRRPIGAGAEASPRRQPGRQDGREEVQGSSAGLRHPVRPREAVALRPFRQRGVRGDGRGRSADGRVGVDGPVWRAGFREHRLLRVLRPVRRGGRRRSHGGRGRRGDLRGPAGADAVSGGAGPRGGRTVEAHLTIPFLTAVRGGETTINLQRRDGKTENLVVKIPPGVETGAKLRLKGQGEPGPKGGQRGDLTIVITVEPHPYFSGRSAISWSRCRSPFPRRSWGPRSTSPARRHEVADHPSRSSSGQKLRLKGQGVPASGGNRRRPVRPAQDRRAQDRRRHEPEVDPGIRRPNKQNPRAGLWWELIAPEQTTVLKAAWQMKHDGWQRCL